MSKISTSQTGIELIIYLIYQDKLYDIIQGYGCLGTETEVYDTELYIVDKALI
jgi:hypothetical protein